MNGASDAARRRSHTRPNSGRWTLAAVITVLLGAVLAAGWAARGWSALADRPKLFDRALTPGTVTVRLVTDERVVAYVERDATGQPPDVRLSVTGPGGAPVATQPYSQELVYDVPGRLHRLGRAIGSFIAPVDGTYTATAAGGDQGATVAIGPDLADGIGPTLIAPGLLFVAFLVLAGIIMAAPSRRR